MKSAAFKQDLLKTNDNNLFLISFSWPWLFFKRVPETGKTEYWSEKKGEKNERSCLYSSQVPHPAGAHCGFLNMKRLGILLLLPGWDDSSSQVTPPPPSILSSFTDNLPVHIYTPGSTEAAVRVECLAQEQGLEPWPLELESSTLSIKPPLLPLGNRKTVPQIVTEWQLTFLKWFFLCSTRIMRIQHFPGIFEL